MTNHAELKSVEEIRAFLLNSLAESRTAPPDTRYQTGFYAALEELERMTDPAGYNRPPAPH